MFEQKREQRLEVQSSFPKTLLNAGRTFVMGVVLGLSGVVVKPVAGMLTTSVLTLRFMMLFLLVRTVLLKRPFVEFTVPGV